VEKRGNKRYAAKSHGQLLMFLALKINAWIDEMVVLIDFSE